MTPSELRVWWEAFVQAADEIEASTALPHPFEQGEFAFLAHSLTLGAQDAALRVLHRVHQQVPPGWYPCFLGTEEDAQDHLQAALLRVPARAMEQGRWVAATLWSGEQLGDVLEGESRLVAPAQPPKDTLRLDLATGTERPAPRPSCEEALGMLLQDSPLAALRTLDEGAQVVLGFFATTEPWTLPAFLNLGGFNANPRAGEHVGVLAHMNRRDDAWPLVLGPDAVELVAGRMPESWQEAFDLAQWHLDYCTDLLEMGYESLREVASHLRRSRLWTFVWE